MSSFKQKLSCLKYLHAISTGGNLSIPQIPSSPICWYRLGLTVFFFYHDIEEGQFTHGFLPRKTTDIRHSTEELQVVADIQDVIFYLC